MNYKYKKGQIFGKRLKVPKSILDKIYACGLSFKEFIEYQLEDKIPISCIIKSDREIVEKFGIDKCKELDWELINKKMYNDIWHNMTMYNKIREILLAIDSQVEDVNFEFYELIKDEISPIDYSTKMQEVYSDRLFIIPENANYNLRDAMIRFNQGEISLQEIVNNWSFYKDKDLSYCLLKDQKNINGITDNYLKNFMMSYGTITKLISNNIDVYSFIEKFSALVSEEEKKEYIKQFTDNILNNSTTIILTQVEYKELFKYSSLEEYLQIFNKYSTKKIIEELKHLPQDYIFNISIPFSELLNYDVLEFISVYGLKNIVDFDNECGHFFTKNDCEMLKLLHYGYNVSDLNKTIFVKNKYDAGDNEINEPYTKDEFYEAVKRMIIYGPIDSSYADKAPYYGDITGEFRVRNKELFISEQAPEELKKLFYTKSITPQILIKNPEFIQYLNGKNLTSCFKNRSIRVQKNAEECNYENFYNFIEKKTSFDNFMKFITEYGDALEIIFEQSQLLFGQSFSYDIIINEEADFDYIKQLFNEVVKSIKFKCVLEFLKIQDIELQNEFRDYVIKFGTNIEEEKIKYAAEVLARLALSNSSEIFAFRRQLATQILNSENPLDSLNKIEDVFIRNNIPTVGKIFSCFEILHPDFQGFDFETSMVSPVLKKSSITSKKIIVFSDLIKSSFGSNNRSINNYLKNIELGYSLYESIKNNQIQFDSLNDNEQQILLMFRNYLTTLYNNSMKAKQENEIFNYSDNVLEDILELSKKISPDGTLDYNLADRVIRMFCGFTGIDTLSQAKEYIDKKVNEADSRNRDVAQSDMVLEQGDFIKGIGDIKYLRNILQNGSVSKEYLGSSSGSDATPLDTDISMITSSLGTISEKIAATEAVSYGPIWFVLKYDDRFITTRTSNETLDTKRDLSKMEVFYTGVVGDGHYGIRTGFASSEINYIVMENYDLRVGLEIALNGFYIPVVNKEGKIVFTPKDYDDLRAKMSGLSYFDEDNFVFSENLIIEGTKGLAQQIAQSNYEVQVKRKKINNIIKKSLKELGLDLKTNIDGDLTEGIVELIDTGSTGRGTNKPGDGDFDFMMRLDRKIISNSSKLEELKQVILRNLGRENSSELTGNGDFRLKNVEIDNDTYVDIDITFVERTDKISYSTDMALQDRLATIKRNNPEKYKYVVANILLAKQVLKEAEVYKPNRGEIPQGGLGGVGIENWILQNGGSFIDAARSFVEASEGKSFSEFQSIYQVWDFGENHMAERRGQYSHDNFVSNNMSEIGYEKMIQALKEYLKFMEITQIELANESDDLYIR